MRTKIFLLFLVVIAVALISNVIFRILIERDFGEYVKSTRQDQLYWIMAAVEGSNEEGEWDKASLSEALHWGIMLGFDLEIVDRSGTVIMDSARAMGRLKGNMHRRMMSLIDITSAKGPYEEYPLFMKGEEIGTLRAREFMRKGNLAEKENIFKRRGREFLVISFLIAGGGAVLLSFLFINFLTKPVLKLKKATEEIAAGNFSVQVNIAASDEIGELAKSFNYMSSALKKEDEIRRRLVSNIAHELRTPLAVLKATLEGVSDGVIECTQEQNRSLKDEVDRLVKLVKGIEDITRAEASFLRQGNPEEIELREFLDRQLATFTPLADEKGLKLTLREGGVVRVFTDPGKLATIISNLLANAIKFTDHGEIYVEYGAEPGNFHIIVADTGRGVGQDELDRIFERFYKAKDSPGMGIGLSIVKELVTILNGEIRIDSAPGKGSRFTVVLPGDNR